MLKASNKALDDALHTYKFIDKLTHFKRNWVRKTIAHNYLHAVSIIFKRFYTYFDTRRNLKLFPKNTDILLYINSQNTYHSLNFLENERTLFFEQSNRIALYHSRFNSEVHNIKSPPWLIFLAMINFPIFAIKYWGKVLKYPNLYFENWGKDYVNKSFLVQMNSIKKVVFANDHNVENRLFKWAAERCNIKTIYLQHASITKFFPQLSFDQSFLFGEVDLIKYRSIGKVKGNAILLGAPKFDELYPHRRDGMIEKKNVLGLALNLVDKTEKVKLLVDLILEKTSYNISIRMHPGDQREFYFDTPRVEIHNAKHKPLQDFFKGIDFLISGESSIHLEANYLNIPSFSANLTQNPPNDYYQFISKGLIEELAFENISEDYLSLISEKRVDFSILKSFIHSVLEKYDGQTRLHISNQILNL